MADSLLARKTPAVAVLAGRPLAPKAGNALFDAFHFSA